MSPRAAFVSVLTLLSLLSLIGNPTTAEARRQKVDASGEAVTAGSPVQVRANAVQNAFKHAVEQVAGSLGGPKEGDDSAIDRAVYERAASFVAKYTVTNESSEDNVLTLEISAEVDVDALSAALGGKRGKAGSAGHGDHGGGGYSGGTGGKRVLVLATEQLGPHQIFGWTDVVWGFGPNGFHGSSKTTMLKVNNEMGGMEATMSDGFTSGGFDVIDPHVLKGKLAPRPAFEVLDITAGEAKSIAEKSDADLVVIAKGVAKVVGSIGDMESGQANVVARLVRIRDGKVLASTTQHAAQVHIDSDTAKISALNEATKMAASDLVKKARQ